MSISAVPGDRAGLIETACRTKSSSGIYLKLSLKNCWAFVIVTTTTNWLLVFVGATGNGSQEEPACGAVSSTTFVQLAFPRHWRRWTERRSAAWACKPSAHSAWSRNGFRLCWHRW